MYIVDMRESVLTLPYFSTSELTIGSRVEGVVDRAQDKGVVVRVGGASSRITAFVSLLHMNDAIRLSHVCILCHSFTLLEHSQTPTQTGTHQVHEERRQDLMSSTVQIRKQQDSTHGKTDTRELE